MREGLAQHLEALRWALLRSLVVLILAALVLYWFSEQVLEFLAAPVGHLYFFTPPEAFWAKLKLSMLAAAVLTAPYVISEVWFFVAPGLKPREKRWGLPGVLFAVVMFYAGCALALFGAVPIGVKFLASFGGEAMSPFFGASSYINFVALMVLSFGVLFETPVVMMVLTGIGLMNPSAVAKKRSYVIVAAFAVAAVVTPTVDFITQIALALPLILLFEMGLLLSRMVLFFKNRPAKKNKRGKKKKKRGKNGKGD